MLEFYRLKVSFYHKDKFIGNSDSSTLLLDEEPQNETKYFNWDELSNLYDDNRIILPPFSAWTVKGKKRICYRNKTISEKREPILNLRVEFTYTVIHPSLLNILKWYDAKKANEYLIQHNLLQGLRKEEE